MNIGVVGLGLIGGSIAKSIKQNTDYKVFGTDIQDSVIYCAKLFEAIDDALDEKNLSECDMLIVALYPKDTIDYINTHAASFKKGCIVTDCGGVKEMVCEALLDTAIANDFVFIGAHPMAGIENSGFRYAHEQLFCNASMLITPYHQTPLEILDFMKQFWLKLGFSNITLCSPEEHDRMIAYTSQLAHVVSSAYVKSKLAPKHQGFSAGSFRDMTRVAKLNENLWTELFFANRQNLISELNGLLERLVEYRDALQFNEPERVKELLQEGRKIKESIAD
ncbi:prephenate dehydrogenase [Peptococcaceae bacterium 1198_IL3148]